MIPLYCQWGEYLPKIKRIEDFWAEKEKFEKFRLLFQPLYNVSVVQHATAYSHSWYTIYIYTMYTIWKRYMNSAQHTANSTLTVQALHVLDVELLWMANNVLFLLFFPRFEREKKIHSLCACVSFLLLCVVAVFSLWCWCRSECILLQYTIYTIHVLILHIKKTIIFWTSTPYAHRISL